MCKIIIDYIFLKQYEILSLPARNLQFCWHVTYVQWVSKAVKSQTLLAVEMSSEEQWITFYVSLRLSEWSRIWASSRNKGWNQLEKHLRRKKKQSLESLPTWVVKSAFLFSLNTGGALFPRTDPGRLIKVIESPLEIVHYRTTNYANI